MQRSLTSGFLSIVNAKLLMSLIGVATLPLIVRVLGPTGYGDYAFLLSTFSLLMILVSSGVTEGVQKFVAEDRTDAWRERIVGFYLRLALLLAVLGSLAVAGVTWSGLVSRLLAPRFETYFYLLAGLVLTAQLRSFTRRALLGLGLEPYSESLSVVGKLVFVGIGLGLATAGFGVAGFLAAKAIAATLFTVVGFALLARRVSIRSALSARDGSLPRQELLSFNGLNVVLVLLLMSLFHVDVLMLGVLTDSARTGFYKAALALAQYMWLVPTAIQTLLLHSTADLWTEGRHERVERLAGTITRYVFLFTALLAIGVFALADRFVPLYYGQEFAVVLGPLLVLLPGAVGFSLARPLYGINKASGRLVPLILATTVAAGGNAALNWLLIPRYGMIGAGMATSASYGSMFALQVACARYLGYDPLAGVRPVRALATVAVAAPSIVGLDLLVGSTVVALAVVSLVGFCLFWAVALATGAVDTVELRAVAATVPSPVGRVLRSLVS